jgi:hypothetical protein
MACTAHAGDLSSGAVAPKDLLPNGPVGWNFSNVDEADGYFSDSVYDEDELCMNDLECASSFSTTLSNCSVAPLDARERKLIEDNERLMKENMLLRQQCEDITKGAQKDKIRGAGDSQDHFAQASKLFAAALPYGQSPKDFSSNSMAPSQPLPQAMMTWVPWCSTGHCILVPVAGSMLPSHNFDESSITTKSAGVVEEIETIENLPQLDVKVCDRQDTRTTVMLRNLPNNYNRAMLLDLIDSEGFNRQYDFVYLPIDFTTKACFGYAFVNLLTHESATRFRAAFDGFSNWIIPSRKRCIISWSDPHQGLQANIERYQNSPVMHAGVPDEHKPVVFSQGERVSFPESNKKVRAPRIRNFKK